MYTDSPTWSKRSRCGCRKCRAKHNAMFWTIVALLLVIIYLLARRR